LVTAAVFIIYSYIIQHIQKPSSIKANDVEDFEKGNISDIFTNIDSIKYFGKEDYIKNKFKNITDNTRFWMKKNWDYYRWLDSVQAIILSAGTFLMLYFPLVSFLNNEITLGTIVFIYTIYGTLIGPLFGFVHGLREYFRVMADFQSLFEYGKVEQEVKDRPDARPLTITSGSISIDDITYTQEQEDGISRAFRIRKVHISEVAL
jgi:ATP-binding cassette subfamily B protein